MDYDVNKSLSYVFEYGNMFETYKIEFVLHMGRDDKIPLDFFNAYQNKDGGFAYNLKKGNPSSVATTLSIFPWYTILDITYSGSYKRCLNYILDNQKNGAWDENPEISVLNPPELIKPGALNTKLWLSAQAANDILFYDKNKRIAQSTLMFLQQYMREDGTFEGFPITNWIVFSIYSQMDMTDAAQKLVPYIRTNIVHDPKHIVWCLNCLWKAQRENVLADELLDLLLKMQDPNGCWKDEDNKCCPNITAEAIATLHMWGR